MKEEEMRKLVRIVVDGDPEKEGALLQLLGAISERGENNEPNSYINLEEKIVEHLLTLGVPCHIKGYGYLKKAIAMAMEDPSLLEKGITTSFYPNLAQELDTTPSKIERAIRDAIETCWDRGDLEVLQRYFGNTISRKKWKPTNREFITRMVDQIRLEMKRF